MTDDLVKRLRAENPETGLRWSLASESADRIEKLEAALRRLIDYGMVSHQDLERARKALGEEENEES